MNAAWFRLRALPRILIQTLTLTLIGYRLRALPRTRDFLQPQRESEGARVGGVGGSSRATFLLTDQSGRWVLGPRGCPSSPSRRAADLFGTGPGAATRVG